MVQDYTEFLLYENRFLKQVGDSAAHHIWASRDAPVRVKLPSKIQRWNKKTEKYETVDHPESANLRRAPMRPIVDVRPNVNYADTAPANVARADEASDDEAAPGLRAADV